MSISLTRYVDISSTLGAGELVPTRDLIGRLFTSNLLLPPQTFLQFGNAADVGTYFGTNSEEYYRALFYFSWSNKSSETAPYIQFARWVKTAVAPMIYSAKNNNTTWGSNWTSITSGSFGMTIGASTFVLSSLDFSATTDLADVAGVLQTAIQASSMATMWASATVVYNGNGGFTFTGGDSTVAYSAANISVSVAGGGTDITRLGLVGWFPQENIVNNNYTANGSIWAYGSQVETLTNCLTASASSSNNFGSLLFLNNLLLTNVQIQEIATWNSSQNVSYLYTIPVSVANSSTLEGLLNAIGGCALTLSYLSFPQTGVLSSGMNTVTGLQDTSLLSINMPITGTDIPAGTVVASIVSSTSITMSNNATGSVTEVIQFYPFQFPEQLPMMIEAATDYNGLNTVQNYMFQQDNTGKLSPTVTTDSDANTYDAININYYGQTQSAGTQISFYQRGVLQGQSVVTNITDMTAYVNEIWLRDAAGTAIINLILALNQVAANDQGRGQILTVLQDVINQALNNGSISVGKTLSTLQKSYITIATGDDLAWYQVQNNGYWVDVQIVYNNPDYVANYTLIYSKDDVVRKVNGTQILI